MPDRLSLTCERYLFIGRVPSTDGWRMTDGTNGLCPACVAEDQRRAAEGQTEPAGAYGVFLANTLGEFDGLKDDFQAAFGRGWRHSRRVTTTRSGTPCGGRRTSSRNRRN
jgi:hypothetical protein